MFWNNLVCLCNQHETTPTALVKTLGIAAGSVTKWKNGVLPRSTTLAKLADYFGVTVDYLLGKTSSPVPASNLTPLPQRGMRVIPVYETVSAGFGAQAEDQIIDYLPCFISGDSEADNSIGIKVKGDSMYPKIEDGDIIRVVKQNSVESGQLAVVLVDDEGFVKRIVYGHGFVELQSINPLYPPMRFDGAEAERVRVIGLVRQIIKNV